MGPTHRQVGGAVFSFIALVGPIVAVRTSVSSDSTSAVFIVIGTLSPLVITAAIVAYLYRYYRHEFGETLIVVGAIGTALFSGIFALTAWSIVWGQQTYGITMADPLVFITEMAMGGALFGLIYGHFYALSLVQQRKLERTKLQLQRKNERLNEFAGVVSHDIRNPLTVAQGRLELAREESDSEHLDAIGQAHERMDALIDDVLTIARQGESVNDVESISLSAVVKQCWRNVDTMDAELIVKTDRWIRADESRLQQLLENLIRNAIEHGGPEVTVRIGELSDKSGFYIEDDGPGIPDGERGQVFEAGYTTTEEGTGFGLNIVKEIVEAHGWEIHVTDGHDRGARFEITGVETDQNTAE